MTGSLVLIYGLVVSVYGVVIDVEISSRIPTVVSLLSSELVTQPQSRYAIHRTPTGA